MLYNSQLAHNVDSKTEEITKSNAVKKAILIPVNPPSTPQMPMVAAATVAVVAAATATATATKASTSTSSQQINKQLQQQQQQSSPTTMAPTKHKSQRLKVPTLRLELNLDKPSSESFNEFNYNKLALKAFKQLKRISDKLKKSSNKDVDYVKMSKNECKKLDENCELIVNR